MLDLVVPASSKYIWGRKEVGREWNWTGVGKNRVHTGWDLAVASTTRSYALPWAGQSTMGLFDSPLAKQETRGDPLWGLGLFPGERDKHPFPCRNSSSCCISHELNLSHFAAHHANYIRAGLWNDWILLGWSLTTLVYPYSGRIYPFWSWHKERSRKRREGDIRPRPLPPLWLPGTLRDSGNQNQ